MSSRHVHVRYIYKAVVVNNFFLCGRGFGDGTGAGRGSNDGGKGGGHRSITGTGTAIGDGKGKSLMSFLYADVCHVKGRLAFPVIELIVEEVHG